MAAWSEERTIALTVNGRKVRESVAARTTLADFLRDRLALTGTHLGCEQGVCGACNVMLDGEVVRSCLLFAVQADGRSVVTVEGLAAPDGSLHPLQTALWEEHGLQCGFCTPGVLMASLALLREKADPSDREIREALSGTLCRCTGYEDIVTAVRTAARRMAAEGGRGSRGG